MNKNILQSSKAPKLQSSKASFTIVELLIVIVVIGILAAITIVAYRGAQDRANDAVVQSDLRTLGKKIEMFKAEQGVYPLVSDLKSLGFIASTGSYDKTFYNFHYCANSTDRLSYSVQARSKSKNTFYITSLGQKSPDRSTPYWKWNCAIIGHNGSDSTVGFSLQYGYNFVNDTWQAWLK